MAAGWNRRDFLVAAGGAAIGAALDVPGRADAQPATRGPGGPVIISSTNGLPYLPKALAAMRGGEGPLDAVLSVVTKVEDDPNDQSVGLGGIPNEDGIVELDASVMDGATHKAGSVASLRNIRNPSLVARLVMLRTDHELLVGEGALRFAKAHGFAEENLLTEKSRKAWLDWRERRSDIDAWLPPTSQPTTQNSGVDWREAFTYGTINCLALNKSGDLAGVTTTSGLAYKLPGRVGDSPIIGAGLYVDNDYGAAGSTGRGEANLQNCSSFLIVELMGRGMTPAEACMEALRRVAKHTEPRLRDGEGRANFDLKFYALRKDGLHAGASMWADKSAEYAVDDGSGAKRAKCEGLYTRG